MGADIHMYAEAKLPDGTWHMVRSYTTISRSAMRGDLPQRPGMFDWVSFKVASRNYEFFAALAGVRGRGPAPLGLPPDVSPAVNYHATRWGSDGHSHSWLSAHDFAQVFTKHHLSSDELAQLTASRLEGKYHGSLTHILGEYLAIDEDFVAPENIRFVFWFDN